VIVTCSFSTPVGDLVLGSFDGTLCLCDWKYRQQRAPVDRRLQQGLRSEFQEGTSGVLDQAKSELTEYFAGSRQTFSVPCLAVGTVFQKLVWRELQTIPYGTTVSYHDLAVRLGKLPALRAVAAANGANALAVIIPCHRVIGASGELVGYAGGLRAKQKLLELESPGAERQLGLFDQEGRRSSIRE